MKRVLFIAYYFPPAGGSAVQRVLKFAKYLPQYGWQPTVLTAREGDHMLHDDSLSAEVPAGLTVQRSAAPDLYRLFSRLRGNDRSQVDIAAMSAGSGRRSLLAGLAVKIRSAIFIPDARVAWYFDAVRQGKKLLRQGTFDAIFTSAPPFTTALIGARLARFSRLPWISDYRDPWVGAFFYPDRPRAAARMERWLERHLLKRSTTVTAVNQHLLDHLTALYGEGNGFGTAVITNGYDAADFDNLTPVASTRFTILYTGTINARMHPGTLLEAFELAEAQQPGFLDRIELRIVGRLDSGISRRYSVLQERGCLSILNHLPHRTCLEHTLGADVLLLLIPDMPGNELIVTGKVFEYLRAGQPILCLGNTQGEAARIIDETRSGMTFEHNNADAVARWLLNRFRRWEAKQPLMDSEPDSERVKGYEREKLTGRLAEVLNQAAAGG